MSARMLRTIAVVAVCFSGGALAADRHSLVDPAAPYKANRLASQPGQRVINVPGQTTVLTRQVLDDKNATSVRDALRTTPGVTIGR